MNLARDAARAPLAALFLALSAAAQVAASPGFTLDAWTLDAGGGGGASLGAASWGSLASAGGALASPSYGALVGFCGPAQPLDGSEPVLFGLAPHAGPAEGGTPAVLSGVHLDQLGPAPAIAVGGSPAGGVSTLSSTHVALTTPSGPPGPADVTASGGASAATAPGGFVYTPAVTSPAFAHRGGTLAISDWGPPGGSFELRFAFTTTAVPLPPYGTLLIGPSPTFPIASGAYPSPGGIHTASLPIPNDASLVGVALHFQSAAVTSLAPLAIVLTNLTSTTLL
jgi:hypothetical protein